MRNAAIVGTTTLLLALCAIPCVAQTGYRGYPPGSYVQTCRNIHIEGDRLEAVCQERDGDWRRTSLGDFDRCTSEIINNDGRLVCTQGNYGGPRRRPYGDDDNDGQGYYYRGGWQGGYPPGDYVQTCRNIYMEGNRLVAECQERDGDWRRTSLDRVDLCTDQIVNNNGRLVCPQGEGSYGYDRSRGGNWEGGIPSGTYTETCRNIHVDGDRLIADCQKRNGDWRHTSLDDIQSCASAPANDNGRLVCGR